MFLVITAAGARQNRMRSGELIVLGTSLKRGHQSLTRISRRRCGVTSNVPWMALNSGLRAEGKPVVVVADGKRRDWPGAKARRYSFLRIPQFPNCSCATGINPTQTP